MITCRNAQRCATTEQQRPAQVSATNTYCLSCLDRAATRINNLPTQHRRLDALISEQHQRTPQLRRTQPHSIVPLNIQADTLARSIAYTLTQTAELVADALKHDDNPSELDDCAKLIATHITKLADLAAQPVMLWSRAGTWRYTATLSGVEHIEQFEQLSQHASIMLSDTRARTQRDLPCARCEARTVGRWAGSDYYDCTTCGARWHENDVRRQDRILVELYKRGKLRVNANRRAKQRRARMNTPAYRHDAARFDSA